MKNPIEDKLKKVPKDFNKNYSHAIRFTSLKELNEIGNIKMLLGNKLGMNISWNNFFKYCAYELRNNLK